MYKAITRNIAVTVRPEYLADQSAPDDNRYVWAYHVRIENRGDHPVRLRSRHWRITDAMGQTREVRGSGVVGEEPLLQPGQHFEYASGTPLATPSGIMVGSYRMESASGESFDVAIPAFSLDSPFGRKMVH